jgi:hypothetical protein
MHFLLLLPQFDSLVPVMTARESVEFAAAVRLPRGSTRAVQRARVDLVLQLMGLAEQQDMLVSKRLISVAYEACSTVSKTGSLKHSSCWA